MNAVLKRIQEWKQFPLDVIVVSLYHLSVSGPWEVKDKYYHLRRGPLLLPNLPVAISPKEIVQKVRVDSL